MKCPYCNTEMAEGILQSHRYLLWAISKHKLSYRPKNGEVLLDEKMVGDVTVKAYICKDCKKIIVDYNI